jgi:hypothetical protein
MFKDAKQKVLIKTRTGEPYQPSRIYYQVTNQKTVIGAFKKLRCVEWEPTMNAWRWRYDQEARKIRFEVSWNQIPKEHRPVILADFYFRGDHEMIVDVRSFQRIVEVILFFDKHINKRAASVTKVRIVNRYFDGNDTVEQEQLHPPFDHFFDRDDIAIPDPKEFEAGLKTAVAGIDDEMEKIKAFAEFVEKKSKEPLPEIEEVPVHFYEDGIEPLQMSLTMKSVEAMQHWEGNTQFSQFDLIAEMVQVLKNDLPLLDEDALSEADEASDENAPESEPAS